MGSEPGGEPIVIEAVTLSVDVPDLEAGVEFYTEGLGIEAIGRASEDAFELRADGVRIDLLERAPGTSATPDAAAERRYDRHWTPVHLDLVVDDVDAALERARAEGATVESGPRDAGGEVVATLSDPFGNGFCLLQAADE